VIVRFPTAGPAPDPAQMQAALAAALAFLNDAAAAASAPDDDEAIAQRTLTLGKILRVLPLPGHPGESLIDIDADTDLPALADVAPFVVSAFVQQSDGLTKALLDDASSYVMTPGERLGLTAVTLVPE